VNPVELVKRHLTEALSGPPDAYSFSHLNSLDLPHFQLVLALPKHMSRGGDLPFVVCGDRVLPGNLETLEEIVRVEGLGERSGLTAERFVQLFFLLVVVGCGGPVAPPEVERLVGRTEIRAVTGDGVDRAPVAHRIAIDDGGHITWSSE